MKRDSDLIIHKLKKTLPLMLLLVISFFVQSQDKVDSLVWKLGQLQQEDTIKVNLLNKIGFEYWIIDPEQSEVYGKQGLALASQLKYKAGIAYAQRVLGVAHWSRGNYELALSHLFEGLEVYEKITDSLGIANCLMNVGLVYADQQNYKKALANYMKAEKLFIQLNHQDRVGTTYNKIGSLYTELYQYDKALQYLEDGLIIHQQNHFNYGISESNNRLGVLYMNMGKLDRGLTYFVNSLDITRNNNDLHGTASNLLQIGSIYNAKNDFYQAKQHLTEGISVAKKVKSKQILRDLYFELKTLYKSQEQYEMAMDYYDLYSQMKDSIFSEEKAVQLANLQTKFELADKEKALQIRKNEIAVLEQQAKYDQVMRLILIMGLLVIGILAYLIISKQRFRIKRNKELLIKNKELFESEQALTDAELENAKLKQHKLEKELEFKNKELTSFTLNFIQKNELMEELKENITKIKKEAGDRLSGKLNSLNRLVDNSLHVDRDWEDFKLHFENVHKDFFQVLKDYNADLSNYELKLCALIRLNLNMKETATILGISAESVKTARYRLRKKLGLSRENNLIDFILDLEKKSQSEKVLVP